MKVKICLFISILLNISCGTRSNSHKKEIAYYFDINKLIAKQITRLDAQHLKLKKTTVKDSIGETRLIKQVQWANELHFFTKSDINRPAWRKSYKISTILNKQKRLQTTLYEAIEPTLITRKIEVVKDAHTNDVKQLCIMNRSKNILYQLDEYLEYTPDSGYYIERNQNVRFINGWRFIIEGEFLK